MARKRATDDDLMLWEHFREGIDRLQGKQGERLVHIETTLIKSNEIRERRSHEHFAHHTKPLLAEPHLHDVRKQIRVRKVCVESRLDLHGYTRQEAMAVLQKFILSAQLRGCEWVLIITGKGNAENPVTLRKLVPQWLETISQVNGYAPAKQRDGGAGAYYVRIRKRS